MRVLVAAIIAGLWESFRETLPDSDETAGAFISGMAYSLLLFIAMLIFTSWLWSKALGVAL